jgi:hypothetical protein
VSKRLSPRTPGLIDEITQLLTVLDGEHASTACEFISLVKPPRSINS